MALSKPQHSGTEREHAESQYADEDYCEEESY